MNESRHVVLLGCGDYQHREPLRCSVADVEAMRAVLASPSIGGFDDVVELTNGETRDTVLSKLEGAFIERTAPSDVVLFYFSGHGVVDGRGQTWIALEDSADDRLDSTGVGLDWLMDLSRRSPSNAVVMVLDCCYGGAIGDVLPSPAASAALQSASSGQSLYVMTSSTATQRSFEKESERNSVFTGFLASGLETGRADRDNDGQVTVDEAYAYARHLMPPAGRQDPVRFNYNVKGDLTLARNPLFRPVDVKQVAPEQVGKFMAVGQMVEIVRAEEDTTDPDQMTVFAVVVLGEYRIDGEAYGAMNAVTVSQSHTPNIVQTQTGFECDAFYPPELLTEHALTGKEVFDGRVKVRLEVELDAILGIVGKSAGGTGPQLDLFA